MRRCTKCGEEKPLDQFNRDKSRKSGIHPWCKPCARKRRADWYEKNRAANLAYQADWRARNLDKKHASDAAWKAANRERKAASDAAYRLRNYEKVTAYIRAYHQERKDTPEFQEMRARLKAVRRARLAGVEHQPYTRREIYERDGGKCRACNVDLPFEKGSFHIDHIVPVKLDGPDIPANLQLMCPPCNQRKWATLHGQIHLPV